MKGYTKTFIILGSIFMFISILFIVITILTSKSTKEFMENAEPTTATIVDIDTYYYRGNKKHNVYVSYFVDGVNYTSELDFYSSMMNIGDNIEVYYDPDSPYHIMSVEGNEIMIIIQGVFIIISFIIGSGFLGKQIHNYTSMKNLRSNGLLLNGKVIRCDQNYNVRINHEHPYYIVCEARLPNGEIQTFKSRYITYVPDYIMGQSVNIYVNRNNYKKYFVDINKLNTW